MNGRLVLISILAVLLAGCSATMQRGAGLGGAVGAVAGAVIDTQNPWRGAAIGGAIGAGTGAVIADDAEQSVEQRHHHHYRQTPPRYYQPAPPPSSYRMYVREQVYDGYGWRIIDRQVTVFWYQPYRAWGYWSMNGRFIYAD
ncbi:MAG: hypothetical protein K8F91_25225 [Candidatus Obscuribacterales bacterium]|nr:hypothetical protein [Candidatus Obscuribacterales bacterium]